MEIIQGGRSSSEQPPQKRTIDVLKAKDTEHHLRLLLEDVRKNVSEVAAANLESILLDPVLDAEKNPAKKQTRWLGLSATDVSIIRDFARQHGIPLPPMPEPGTEN